MKNWKGNLTKSNGSDRDKRINIASTMKDRNRNLIFKLCFPEGYEIPGTKVIKEYK